MPHYVLVTDETGRLREVGVAAPKDAPSVVGNDGKSADTQRGVSSVLDVPEGLVEDLLHVEEEEDLPPQQPEDESDEQVFACDECGKPCSSPAGLAAHVRAKHKE